MKRLVAIGACLVLSGCASYVWVRPDATPEMLARDRSQCEAEARYVARDYELAGIRYGPWGVRQPLPPPAPGLQIEQEIFQRCMELRGYRLEKETSQRG